MSTRYYGANKRIGNDSVPTGFSGEIAEKEYEIPSCEIEDIDRAIYDLFNSNIKIFYDSKSGEKIKVPVRFVAGERWALWRGKDHLKDQNGAFILPIITIERKSVDQDAGNKLIEPGGSIGTIDIKRRISEDDAFHQRLKNSSNFKNSSQSIFSSLTSKKLKNVGGRLMEEELGSGLYETITIPMPKFFTVRYEICIWTQYMKHSNKILTAIANSYHDVKAKTIRIETSAGYWFVAFFETNITDENNVDSMTDEERIIKHTFSLTVPAYMILAADSSRPFAKRKQLSATDISFGIVDGIKENKMSGGVKDGRLNSFLLTDVESKDINSSIGTLASDSAEAAAGSDTRYVSQNRENDSSIGNFDSKSLKKDVTQQEKIIDPMTGKTIIIKKKMHSSVSGETVISHVTKHLTNKK